MNLFGPDNMVVNWALKSRVKKFDSRARVSETVDLNKFVSKERNVTQTITGVVLMSVNKLSYTKTLKT